MVGTDIFLCAVLTSFPFLNVVTTYPATSHVMVVYQLAWLEPLQSHTCPLIMGMRPSSLMLEVACFLQILNWDLFPVFSFAPALALYGFDYSISLTLLYLVINHSYPLCVMRQHRAGTCNCIIMDFNVETQFTK